jgi:hypothetical protein
MVALGSEVLVEAGADIGSGFPDDAKEPHNLATARGIADGPVSSFSQARAAALAAANALATAFAAGGLHSSLNC